MTAETPLAIPPRLAEAMASLAAAAIRVAAYSGLQVPPDYWAKIRRAVDAGEAGLTVQCDLPSGNVRVLAAGSGWPAPVCLLAIDLAQPADPTPPPAAA